MKIPLIVLALFSTAQLFSQSVPDPAALFLSNGNSLDGELSRFSGDGYVPSDKRPDVRVLFDRKNILCVSFEWSYYGAYPTEGTEFYSFDLRTKREISLWSEIAPDRRVMFNAYLCSKLQPTLDKHRKNYADSEWETVLGLDQGASTSDEDVDSRFKATDLTKQDTYYLEDGHLVLVISGYFGLPHASMALDLFGQVDIPFMELKKYLKPTSAFQDLSEDN